MKFVFWIAGIAEAITIGYLVHIWPGKIDPNHVADESYRRAAERLRDDAVKRGDSAEAERQTAIVQKYTH